jgi:sulfotransferase family protein
MCWRQQVAHHAQHPVGAHSELPSMVAIGLLFVTDVYLHLGAHKTGTKYQQAWLAANREFLAAQGSRFVPGRRIQADVRRWRWNPSRENIPPSLPKLFTELTNLRRRSCVLSWEGMLGPMDLKATRTIYPHSRVILEVLHDQLRDSNTKVAYAVRDYGDWVESSYKWMVRLNRSYTFEEYMEGVELDALTWVTTVTAMRELFGAENVLVWSHEAYRRDSATGDEELLRFLYGADADLSKVKRLDSEERNTSPNAKGFEFARGVHHLLEQSDLFSKADRKHLNPLLRRFVTQHFDREFDPEPPVFLDETTRKYLTSRYEADCRELGIVV